MSEKAALSLSLKSRSNVLNGSRDVASVFNQDSDPEDASATAEDKFREKYGNKKEKDERAVKKVLEEDETVYDYDAHYDEMERRKEELKSKNQQSAKGGGPKYADKLQKAKQRRELEKLIIDERKQERERAEEGGEFEDKETFVTEAYRKQIEEKEQFRKEIEAEERINEVNDVTKSSMYRETFAKRMLDDAALEREIIINGSSLTTVKEEVVAESLKVSANPSEKSDVKKKFVPFTDSEASDGPVTPPPETLKAGLNVKKPKEDLDGNRRDKPYERERHGNRSNNRSRDRDRRDRYDNRDRRDSKYGRERDDNHHRRDRGDYRKVDKYRDSRRRSRTPERRPKKHSVSPVRRPRQTVSPSIRKRSKSPRRRSPSPRRKAADKRRSPDRRHSQSHVKSTRKDKESKSKTRKASSDSDEELLRKEANNSLTSRERQFLEQKRRMKKVKKVLAHRNNREQIEAYTKRYFQRREEGLVVPPLVGQDEKIKY